MCSTSPQAYKLAVKLCNEYRERKQKEQDLNKRKAEEEQTRKKKRDDAQGVSRTVTEIDYNKHEETVKELDRQEKEEDFARKKAEASQWCTLDHEHGPNCRRPVGGCSHDHQKEWAIYEKSTEEKIAAADRFRQEGNEAYRKHNYGLAAVHYRKALLQFDYTFADTEEEERQVESVKVPCLLNLAACKCQQEDWEEVLTQCRLALEINPRSVKAFYRTAQAHLARDDFELAKDALVSAYEIEPQNAEVRAAYVQLKKNMANYKVRRKEVAKEMISSADMSEAASANDCPEDPAALSEAAAAADEVRSAGAGAGEARSPPGAADVRPGGAGTAAAADSQCAQEQASQAPAAPATAAAAAAAAANAALDGPQPGNLRRRRPGPTEDSGEGAVEAEEEEEEEGKEEEEQPLLPPKVLNAILLVALLLGILSVALCTFLFVYGAEAR